MDSSAPTLLYPSDHWAPASGAIARIPLLPPPPRLRRKLEPIRWVHRRLTSPRGQVVEVDVPVYPLPTLDTEYAPRPAGARYITRRRVE